MKYVFNPDDAFRFAKEQGIQAIPRGNELFFKQCPYCKGSGRGNEKTFSINLDNGQFQCFRSSCGIKGNMITLSKDFGFGLGSEIDEYYRPRRQYRKLKTPKESIKPKPQAIQYLESRGISSTIAARYEITVQTNQENVLVFPFYDEKSQLQFVKYRKTDFNPEKDRNKEWCEENCKPILFGMKQCNDRFDRLVITEGQIDSLSVAEAGIENAVSVPTGANGFTWVPYCYNWVSKFQEIIVFGDHEKEHITLLEDVAKRFSCKIKHVREEDYKDCKDANELLQKHGAAAVKNAVNNAIMIPVEHVLQLADVERVNIYEMPKLRTGIAELDRTLYGGIPFGCVCLISGKRGDGKSTFASQIMTSAVDQGRITFAYSGELPNFLYKSWFDFQIAGSRYIIENQNQYGVNRFITNSTQELIDNWYRDRAYIYDSRIIKGREHEDLLLSVERAITQYGAEVILIDNLMTAMYIDEVKGSSKYDQQGEFVHNLTEIALRYNCLILLVAHQRKNSFMMDVNDEVGGSGDITNLAGIALYYNRGTRDELEKNVLGEDQRKLIIGKNRLFGKVNLKGIILDYDEKSKRIYGQWDDVNKELGWNKREFIPVLETSEEIPFD